MTKHRIFRLGGWVAVCGACSKRSEGWHWWNSAAGWLGLHCMYVHDLK